MSSPPQCRWPLATGKYKDDSGKVILDTIVAEEDGKYKMKEKGGDSVDAVYVYYDEQGYLPQEADIWGLDYKVFKKNPQVGDEWDAWEFETTEDMDDDGTDDSLRLVVKLKIEGQEDVSVPAGTFKKAFKVLELYVSSDWYSTAKRWKSDTSKGYSWWAMGVGLVKEIDSTGKVASQLVEYQVK